MTDERPRSWLSFVLDNCVYAFGCPCGCVVALVLISMTGTALGWWR